MSITLKKFVLAAAAVMQICGAAVAQGQSDEDMWWWADTPWKQSERPFHYYPDT